MSNQLFLFPELMLEETLLYPTSGLLKNTIEVIGPDKEDNRYFIKDEKTDRYLEKNSGKYFSINKMGRYLEDLLYLGIYVIKEITDNKVIIH